MNWSLQRHLGLNISVCANKHFFINRFYEMWKSPNTFFLQGLFLSSFHWGAHSDWAGEEVGIDTILNHKHTVV